jgi:serine/threonine-protein kinase
MGEVWKARDTRLDRTVAIKRLNEAHTKRFEQEARAIAALNHPHICQLYDVGADHLVMEYIEGRPLQSPLPEDETLRLAIQIAGALEEAHRRGIVHRDLKPGNILVTGNGAAKLLDFGLAKLGTSADATFTGTIDGTVMGTVAYMSPEQAEGKSLDARSDIFSFGAVLYEMISGRRAFDQNSTAEILSAVLRDDPPPLQPQSPLQRIVVRCLAKRAAQRFQTASELKMELEKIPLKSAFRGPSIAVLPFANMSADKENEYFSDGLAEEIINALAHVPGLKVTARTSAFAFRGKEEDIRGIAETLGVRTILEGSVRRAGSRLRVTAQLINAEDGYHLWSERYDREMADIFAMQDEIAQAIAAALQVQFSASASPLRKYTPKLDAYEATLKGRHHLLRHSLESLNKARECFERAVALDPQYALAHCDLGSYFVVAAITGLTPAHEAMPRLRAQARKALDLDPSLPDAHAMLGVVAALYDYDWAEAERQFQAVIAQGQMTPFVRFSFALWYLWPLGRIAEAINELRRALQEDPLHVPSRVYLANCLAMTGDYAGAEAQAHQALDLEDHAMAWGVLAFTSFMRGQLHEAVGFAEKAYALNPWVPMPIGVFASLLVRTGEKARGEQLRAKLGDGQVYGAAAGLALFYIHCGETDQAAYWMEKVIEQRHPLAPGLLRGPIGQAIRKTPRWAPLARMVNFPDRD